jgi:membrane-associated phospholipid phosphatase
MRRASPMLGALALALSALLSPAAEAQTEPADAEETTGTPIWQRPFRRAEHPRFEGGWFFDGGVRRVLRAGTPGGRALAASISDGLLLSLLLAPNLSAVAYAFQEGGAPPAAGELVLVNAEAQLGAILTVWLITNLAGRQRPFAWEVALDEACRDPERAQTLDCSLGRNASFVSGHAASAFTGAGLVCGHVAYFGQDDGWDLAGCATAAAAAAATATLRIVSDHHWSTDTIFGALIGIGWGFVVPSLLHFSPDAPLPVARTLTTRERGSVAALIAAGAGAGVLVGALVPVLVALFGSGEDDPLEDVRAGRVQLVPFAASTLGPAVGLGVGGAF